MYEKYNLTISLIIAERTGQLAKAHTLATKYERYYGKPHPVYSLTPYQVRNFTRSLMV